MKIIINTQSMIPIYEQITTAVRRMIISGELRQNDPLPSVRALSRELRISALTVKKAYDSLEEEGLAATIHGKGTYIKAPDAARMLEERRREIENGLSELADRAALYGISPQELRQMLDIITEE